MMRAAPKAAPVVLLLLAILASVSSADRWDEYGEVATRLAPLEPTPMIDTHIGLIESGNSVQLRFPVPADEAVGYWVRPAGVVAFSGKGTSYQLILRRDSADGPVIHEGPVIANGDQWNTANGSSVDITEHIAAEDRDRGHIDVFATGIVADDGWTVYGVGSGRGLLAYAAVLTPELQAQLKAAKALSESGISLIPMPRKIEVKPGEKFPLTAETRIRYDPDGPEDLAFAARELQAVIEERTGLRLEVTPGASGQTRGQINIAIHRRDPAGDPEGSFLEVGGDSQRIVVLGNDAPGCFYGAMTLGQLVQKTDNGAEIPACAITDSPAFPYRIIQYDIARGQTVNVDYVKRVIREFARCKINAVLFYMEDDFRFRKYPFLGREGTFTHEKAKELSDFARQYHVQLIPQFESLGHAGAVLRHEEMADLREAGNAWVFCTCEPRTWEFLDDVFGELVEAFPDSEFIHTGADEFEMSFGLCDRCKAKVADKGLGGLYAEHMNRLNQLVKKRGKTMMFWPSHHGPSPELSNMTIQYHEMLEKDCIPTEWIYHGPSAYPTIKQYQDLGFKDVYCCPAVESYSRMWPDYNTTFRGIRGFYRAGADRGCGGAYCTTWEFMHGALIENSMYGLIFAADCSWNPASTPRAEYNRRFADLWFASRDEALPGLVSDTLSDPVPAQGREGMWRDYRMLSKLMETAPKDVMRRFVMKQPAAAANAGDLLSLMADATSRADQIEALASRNHLTIRAAKLAFAIMTYCGHKLTEYQTATRLYSEAFENPTPEAAPKVARIAAALTTLGEEAGAVADGYAYFTANCGAYAGDEAVLRAQSEQLAAFSAELGDLSRKLAGGEIEELPPGSKFGFITGTYALAGRWEPGMVSEDPGTVRYDATAHITKPGRYMVEFEYDRGQHGLTITAAELQYDGETIARDEHPGWAGSGSSGNLYTLDLPEHKPGAKYEIIGEVQSRGGDNSYGSVWLITR